MTDWQKIFALSVVNGSDNHQELLPQRGWEWPRDTWLQRQMEARTMDKPKGSDDYKALQRDRMERESKRPGHADAYWRDLARTKADTESHLETCRRREFGETVCTWAIIFAFGVLVYAWLRWMGVM